MARFTRRDFARLIAAAGGIGAAHTLAGCAMQPGSPAPFTANWDSFTAGYQCPAWFRDAKFGIWAHWSAQCVPEFGDWYARKMYIQGDPFYEHHCKTYGHPSKFGFMNFDHMWKADKWQPEALMKRYVAAGAKYFVALGVHHDNFDAFNSRYHAWNSTRIGPKKDIVGIWANVAREAGLKFGISNHGAHVWHWFQSAYGYDPEGPLAGVRYDAWRLTKADGKGTWWEGLDPQDLYGGRNMVPPDGISSIAEMNKWHASHDRVWTEAPPPANPAFVLHWKLRALDMIDQYHPDLLYMDDQGLPLGQAGLDVAAHYYNASRAWSNGRALGVLNAKMIPAAHRGALVEDVERGLRQKAYPHPWQTDTCIGDWHYNRARFTDHSYKSVDWVVRALCDIVSKNGNLLLSIPQRGDGTIDADEEKFLDSMADWMADNGEGIFATRPWRVFGETSRVKGSGGKGGMFQEKSQSFDGRDIRFTRKGAVVYAFILGWPKDGEVHIRTLGTDTKTGRGEVERVELLGGTPLLFRRNGTALSCHLPERLRGRPAFGLKIMGRGLTTPL